MMAPTVVEKRPYTFHSDTAAKIVFDVAYDVPVEKSRLVYTDEMKAFRQEVEEDWQAAKAKNPDLVLEVPWDAFPDGWEDEQSNDWMSGPAREPTR
jgi:hypothetical protein